MRPLPLGLAVALVLSGQATAQPVPLQKISIGKVSSDKDCKIYVLADSSSQTYSASNTHATLNASANASGYVSSDVYAASGAYSASGTYAHSDAYAHKETYKEHLYRDCVDNFASLKMSLEAALASSGRFAVVAPKLSRYSVSVRISRIGTEENAMADVGARRQPGFEAAQRFLIANLDYTVSEGSRVVAGGELTKRLQISSLIASGNMGTATQSDGAALYTSIQHEVAETVARAVAFKMSPLLVMSVEGNNIALNYGSPLIKAGTMIQVLAPSGPIRFTVSGAEQGRAIAHKDGTGDLSLLVPGTPATVIEPEDPAANGRRMERVDLP